MPNNPSNSKVTSARGAGMPNQSNLNNPRSYNNEGYNTFDRSNVRLFTTRFSDFHPNFCQPAIEGDVVPLNMNLELRSLNMKTPFFTPVQLEQHYFQVPWSAIAPNTWELFYRQPVKGQDISEEVKPYWDFESWLISFANLPKLASGSKVSFTADEAKLIINNALVFYNLFNNDSLLKNLGYSAPKKVAALADKVFSRLVTLFNTSTYSAPAAGTDPKLTMSDNGAGSGATIFLYRRNGNASSAAPLLTLSERYDIWSSIARGDFGYILSCVDMGNQGAQADTLNEIVKDMQAASTAYTDVIPAGEGIHIDMCRVVAYQLICSQYVSNSNVDDIYTGKMFLHNLSSLFYNQVDDASVANFTYNGVRYSYDIVCKIVGDNIFTDTVSVNDSAFWSVLVNLFAMRRSLRFGDYFLNARTQPLAVGDNYIQVSDNKVSVIDTTKAQWFQRFRNAVNRSSQNINEYLLSISGVQRERIDPQPNFICTQSFNIAGQETEGTNYDQNTSDSAPTTVITNLRTNQSKYAFEVYVDEPSYIIGCVSFNAKYVYPRAIDKEILTTDRFDWFNSFMQHVGDQEILKSEMDSSYDHSLVFGYTLRYAQFKYGLSHATGGFSADALPSWSLLMPEHDDMVGPWRYNHINSNILRNTDMDFDKFFPSLTGSDAAHRFHFIISCYNTVTANSKQQDFPTLL